MKASDAFVKEYSEELSRTSRFDAGALEMVMRNSLSSLDEAGIKKVMPTIVGVADHLGIGLFVAAEILTSGTAKDFARYGELSLAEAAKKLRTNLDALPKDAAMALESVRLMGETIAVHERKPRVRFRRWIERVILRRGR